LSTTTSAQPKQLPSRSKGVRDVDLETHGLCHASRSRAFDRGEETTLKLDELAGRIAGPRSVLEQLMPVMRSAGIARSLRGPKGGYRLNTRPEENHTRARRATL
jgi:hypothetical protein